MSDRIFGVIALIAICFYAWGASMTQEPFLPQAVGPKVMPYILSALGAFCAVYFISRPDAEPSWPARNGWFEILAAVFVMVVYTQMLPVVGFFVASTFCAAYFIWRFFGTPLQAGVGGVVISFGIYAVFHLALGLSLAKGPWGF